MVAPIHSLVTPFFQFLGHDLSQTTCCVDGLESKVLVALNEEADARFNIAMKYKFAFAN